MSELNEQEKPATHESLRSLLFNDESDFLIRNDGQRVKAEELEGKHVALYFADRFHASRDFTPVLAKIYKKLLEKGDFEIVFVFTDFIHCVECECESDDDEGNDDDGDSIECECESNDDEGGNDDDGDNDDDIEDRWELSGKNTRKKLNQAFEESHHTMPWLALPFSDENTRKKLKQAFQVNHIPSLVVLDKDGKIITPYGVEVFEEFGVEGYPFTAEKIDEARAKVKAFWDAQTLESLLVSDDRDFVIGHGERKVPVAELLGKTVVLYFSVNGPNDCYNFTSYLLEFYDELRERGETIEIVFLSDDEKEIDFQKHYKRMPWLALPFGDKTIKKLFRYFRLLFIPNVVIVHPDGKLHWELPESAYFYITGHGTQYYPFTKERLDEIEAAEAKEKARRESQTLESLLVSDERDFVIKHGGTQVPVAQLVGKTVGLYFCTLSDSCCQGYLTAKIANVYKEIKERGEAFEIVFISGDKDQEAFEDHYKSMPWLALPFGDKTSRHLEQIFGRRNFSLIVIGPDGKTLRDEAQNPLLTYGAMAFPFSDAHIERAVEELAQTSPKEIYSRVYNWEGPLVLTRIPQFSCEHCYDRGFGWCYSGPYEGFNVEYHLTCALEFQTEGGHEHGYGETETETETETESESEEGVEEEKGQKTDGEIDAA